MDQAKFKRLVVSSTIGAVLLLFILLVIMVYQLIAIKVEQNNIAELERRITEYNVMIENGEDVLEARKELDWIVRRAYELGYQLDDDITLN
ncbi:MAG: hypothetical protein IJW43_03990 [Clostridia bacterium]|nr:hypothetical protein [Clostridia bacterium]